MHVFSHYRQVMFKAFFFFFFFKNVNRRFSTKDTQKGGEKYVVLKHTTPKMGPLFDCDHPNLWTCLHFALVQKISPIFF